MLRARQIDIVGCPRRVWTAGIAVIALCATALFSGVALAAAPEAPVTKAATSVTGTTATLNGELNPNASAEAGYDFTYRAGESCTEGATTPEEGPVIGKGVKVSSSVSELEARTEYAFCLVATHLEGEVIESTPGLPQSFKTLAAKPVVASQSATGLTPFGATLEAQINSENEATTSCVFEYGETSSYGSSSECSPASLEGSEVQATGASIAGLEPATTYHFRVVVANATGETKGADGEFTTSALESPLVSGESVSALTSTAATISAQVNPNYQETTYSFEYATNEGLVGATNIEGAGALPAAFAELLVSTRLSSLQPATAYYFRVVAKNATGTMEGPIEHFTTTTTPSVGTGVAQNVTQTSATVLGTINPAGAATTYRFVYADQAGYEAAVAAATDPYSRGTPIGTLGVSYETQEIGPTLLTELKPGTTYHYALVATNSVGTTTGSDATFTTAPPTPPIASTGSAEGVTQSGATIHGSVDTRGLRTIARFEFGTTPYAGSLTAANAASGSASALAISASFGSYLQPGITYYYRVVATNRDGTAYGAELSFTTGTFPSPFTFPAGLPLLPNPDAAALEEHAAPKPGNKPLTNKQKLAKALKACEKKPKRQRAVCQRSARKRYGSAQRKKAGRK